MVLRCVQNIGVSLDVNPFFPCRQFWRPVQLITKMWLLVNKNFADCLRNSVEIKLLHGSLPAQFAGEGILALPGFVVHGLRLGTQGNLQSARRVLFAFHQTRLDYRRAVRRDDSPQICSTYTTMPPPPPLKRHSYSGAWVGAGSGPEAVECETIQWGSQWCCSIPSQIETVNIGRSGTRL